VTRKKKTEQYDLTTDDESWEIDNDVDPETIKTAKETAIMAKAEDLAKKCVEKLDKDTLPYLQKYESICSNASEKKNQKKKEIVVDGDQGFVSLVWKNNVVESRFGSVTRDASISDFFEVVKGLTFAKKEDDTVKLKGDVRQSKTDQNLYSASFVLNKLGFKLPKLLRTDSFTQANLTFKIFDNKNNQIMTRNNGKSPDYIIYGDGKGVATKAHENSYNRKESQFIESLLILIYTSEDGKSYEMNGICRTDYSGCSMLVKGGINATLNAFGKNVFPNVINDIKREVKSYAVKNQPEAKQ